MSFLCARPKTVDQLIKVNESMFSRCLCGRGLRRGGEGWGRKGRRGMGKGGEAVERKVKKRE